MSVDLNKHGLDAEDLAGAHERRESGITLRALIIGFVAIVPGVFWGVYGDVVSQTDLLATSLLMPPIIILSWNDPVPVY